MTYGGASWRHLCSLCAMTPDRGRDDPLQVLIKWDL